MRGSEPDNCQVSADRLPDFSNEEIHIGTAHANTYDRYRGAFVAACNCQKSALGRQYERLRLRVQEGRDRICPRRRPNGHLHDYIDILYFLYQTEIISYNSIGNLARCNTQMVNSLVGSSREICKHREPRLIH